MNWLFKPSVEHEVKAVDQRGLKTLGNRLASRDILLLARSFLLNKDLAMKNIKQDTFHLQLIISMGTEGLTISCRGTSSKSPEGSYQAKSLC
ncbi:hypothetical protein WG66_012770 [Moniliophthora roreri]|nr:hypothetical protein WG66_012770 [Moniliophthora roreri]